MAPRALGALLALLAAVAFAVSIATSAWWVGHPVVDGRPITAKDVHVGLLGAEGCNTGGDGSCETVEVGTTFQLATYGELAIVGLTALLAFALAISAWKVGDRRKGLARTTMLFALLAGAGGAVVFALGPAIKASQHVDVPIGWGIYLFAGAIASSLLGAAIARKLEPEPLRLKPGARAAAAAAAAGPILPSPQVDVREMLRDQHDGMLHPGSRSSEPRIGHEPPVHESVPLFGSAPQLRPLYDPHNAGVVPAPPQPALPMRAPTPMPYQAVKQLTGLPTPPPMSIAPNNPSPAHPKGPDPFAQNLPPPARPNGPDPFAQTAPAPALLRAESEPIEPPPPIAPPRMPPPTMPPAVRTNPPPPRTSSPPASPRASSATSSPPQRPNPPTNPPRPKSLSNPPRPLPPTMPVAGTPPRSSPTSPPRMAPPGPKTSTVTPPTQGRTQMMGAVPPPALETVPPRGGKKVTVPPPARNTPQPRASQPTLSHAVPPMPSADNQPAPPVLPAERGERAATEADDRLETGMRETEAFDAVGESTDIGPAPDAPSSDQLAAEAPPVDATDQTKPPDDMVERNPKALTPLAPAPVAAPPVATPAAESEAAKIPITTAPSTLPPPKKLAQTTSGPTPACPQCEAPMAWVEEHLRFYCKSCRMYF